jgi:hypothetical protein
MECNTRISFLDALSALLANQIQSYRAYKDTSRETIKLLGCNPEMIYTGLCILDSPIT